MGHDVFISHAAKDKAAADAVCAALEANGVRCWIAPRDIKPGENWAASILRGIAQSRMMVLVFSAHSNGSNHIFREVERAVHRGIPIAPLRIQDAMPQDDLEYFLSSSHWMDALTPPLQKHLREFSRKVRALLEVQGQPPGNAPDLSAALPERRAVVEPAPHRRPNRVPVLLVTIFMLLAGGAAGWVFRGELVRRFADANRTEVPMPKPSIGPMLPSTTVPSPESQPGSDGPTEFLLPFPSLDPKPDGRIPIHVPSPAVVPSTDPSVMDVPPAPAVPTLDDSLPAPPGAEVPPPPGGPAVTSLNGGGTDVCDTLYALWVVEYHKAHSGVEVDYKEIGSGGIEGIIEKTLDFAGSDVPMNKAELVKAGGAATGHIGANIVEFPSCAGGVVPAYDVPGLKGDLKFTGNVLAEIYLGKITNWNDPEIAALNPDEQLPNLVIKPCWRDEDSGTTFVWTNYLVTQNKEFADTIGAGKKVHFPLGTGGKGDPGVAAIIQKVTGAVGYIEQSYAVANNITYGTIQNAAGEFVKASPESVFKAGEGAVDQLRGEQLIANIWNQAAKGAYPVSSFTYLIAYKDLNNLKTKEQAQALIDFFWWATHEGQSSAGPKGYAPLSEGVQKKVDEELQSFTFQGTSIKPTMAK